jgi:hypothetical protein
VALDEGLERRLVAAPRGFQQRVIVHHAIIARRPGWSPRARLRAYPRTLQVAAVLE